MPNSRELTFKISNFVATTVAFYGYIWLFTDKRRLKIIPPCLNGRKMLTSVDEQKRKLTSPHYGGYLSLELTDMKRLLISLGMLTLVVTVLGQTYTVELENKAKAGNSEAQFQLGFCLQNGWGAKQDCEKAITWYVKAAEQGSGCALYKLGDCFLMGKGVNTDKTEAEKYYGKAAKILRVAAKESDSVSMCFYGLCLSLGNGVKEDDAKGFYYVRKSAEMGYPYAQWVLANYYYFGHYFDDFGNLEHGPNYERAFKWYYVSAKQKFPEAEKDIIENGYGIYGKYCKPAIPWIRKLADDGYIDAIVFIAEYEGNDEYGGGNEKESMRWYEIAARNGHYKSLCELVQKGNLMYRSKDYNNAVHCFEIVRQAHNNTDISMKGFACYMLSKCYRFGRGVAKDIEKANQLQEEAKQNGWDETRKIDDLINKMNNAYYDK